MTYECPVCGYDNLRSAPADDMICPCCGTQFGYDDYAQSYSELRRNWIRHGCQWFSRRTLPPAGWSMALARAQMVRAGLLPVVAEFEGLQSAKADLQLIPIAKGSTSEIFTPDDIRNVSDTLAVKRATADYSVGTYPKAV